MNRHKGTKAQRHKVRNKILIELFATISEKIITTLQKRLKYLNFVPLCLCAFISLNHFVINPAFSNEADDTEKIYSFAEHLFDTHDYYRAITEYKRFIFLYPDHKLKKDAELKIGYAYKLGNRWDDAISVFEKLSERYVNEEAGIEAAYQLGEVYYLKKGYILAIDKFKSFVSKYPKDNEADKAKYKTGWSYLYLEDFKGASLAFREIKDDSRYFKDASALSEEVMEGYKLSMKSPLTAGILSSIIPGAGQAYTERYSDSAVAFLLNGLFIWGTVELIEDGNQVAAAILAFFEAGWYSGNIYNAASNAHKYNKRLTNKFINDLNIRHLISFNTSGKKLFPRVAFNLKF